MRESRFVPLVEYMRPKQSDADEPDTSGWQQPATESGTVLSPDEARVGATARRFYARIEDALQAALPTLLRDCVHTILGRELTREPADFRAIVARLVDGVRDEEPLRLRVHPSRIEMLTCDLPVHADSTLGCDDCVIELRSGSLDARFATRIDALIARAVDA